MQRPHPAQRARPPAHGFRPGEIADRGLDHLSDDRRGRAPRLFQHRKIDLAFLIIAQLKLIARQAGGA